MKEIIVDIGCGPKNNLTLYGFNGEPTIAIDSNNIFLQRRRNGNSGGNLVQADAVDLPVKRASVDHVFATHVLEHVDNLERTINETDRVLKPGGRVTVAVPHPRYESVMKRFEKDYFSPKMHQRVIAPKELAKLLEDRDYEITSQTTRGFIGAAYISFMYFLHRRLLKDRTMEPHSGHLISETGENQVSRNVSRNPLIDSLRRRILQTPIFSAIDRLYPFETFIQATKNGRDETI